MSTTYAPRTPPTDQDGPAPPRPTRPPRPRGGRSPVSAGQIVAVQAAVALLVAASGAGYVAVGLAGVTAAVLVALSWIRMRGRWLYQWLGVGLGYLSRRRVLASGGDGTALLGLIAPGTGLEAADLAGDAATLLVDGYGLTAVLEVGDPAGLIAETGRALPSPASLLPAAGPDAPRVVIQMLVSGVPAPVARVGAATSATSYRQLTEGRLLGQERVLLAVRVLRDEGWAEEDLRRALSSVVRKVRRKLGGTPTRVLGETAVLRALIDLAHHDGVQPAREAWPAVHLGGSLQAAFRLTRWPAGGAEAVGRLVSKLLALPATAVTVSLHAGPTRPVAAGAAAAGVPVDLVVRVAAANAAALSACARTAGRLAAVEGAGLRRMDGEQLDGFRATLPLGGPPVLPLPGRVGPAAVPAGMLAELALPVGMSGLMVGTNRRGAPVLARLFRAEPTRAVLIGGVRGAQLITIRAMALGARVVVQTARPQVWEPFVRGVSAPGETIAVIPPGRPVPAVPGTPLHPLLLVVDVGPVAADGLTGAGWAASLIVRDELSAVDTDALARADLVVLQPLQPDEAALAGATLGLGEAAGWLTRIRPDMVGVVNRRAVRWALLSPTPIEHQLIGSPGRT